MPVIAGCLRGLGSTLVNFTQAVDEGTNLKCFYQSEIRHGTRQGSGYWYKFIFMIYFQVLSTPKIFIVL